MKICLFEDKKHADFFPLTYMRPVWDLICGTETLKEGIEKVSGSKIKHFYSSRGQSDLTGEFVFVNGRLLAGKETKKRLNSKEELYLCGGEIVMFKGTKQKFEEVLFHPKKFRHQEVSAVLLEYPWELLLKLKGQMKKTKIEKGAQVSKHAVLDDSQGPIFIGAGTVVHPFSYLRGPLYIGRNCRIAGEVVASIIHDNVNKGHYGFLGHSYVCSWVNLGAGTTNSNLKNNYGPVKVFCGGETVDTGQTFIGCFIGDHAKTAIGTLIYTGCVIGVSANIFGVHHVKKFVPSFSWGARDRMPLDKASATARAMMSRRGVEFSSEYAKLFRTVYENTKKVPQSGKEQN